jgi:glutathione S-transferase
MRLFYVPKTRATRPRWVLEELGVPCELVRLDASKGETRAAEHLTRHPLGHVPVLEDEGTYLFESAAICLYLADKFPEKGLAPRPGTPARGQLYQWLFYAVTELEPQAGVLSAQRRKVEGERDAVAMEAARAQFEKAVQPLEALLSKAPFLVGGEFGIADVIVGAIVIWGKSLGAWSGLPALEAWAARLRDRPAFRRAMAD